MTGTRAAACLAVLLFQSPARAQSPEAKSAASAADPAGGLDAALRALQDKLAPRAGAERLFEVLEKDGKRYLVLKQSQLERRFLLGATLERGTGEHGLYSTMQDATLLIAFRWAGQRRIHVVREDVSRRAEPGTPEGRAVEASHPDSVLAALPIVSSDGVRGTYVVSADELFLADPTRVAQQLKSAYPDAALNPAESSLQDLSAFPRNLEARSELSFRRGSSANSALPDSHRIVITMRYSISELPEAGFEPRDADPRVGYFQTGYEDYSRSDLKHKSRPAVRLANRWRLEKAEPDAPLSPPKQPIVFWLEDTVPEEHRPALRAGILAWNQAFEAVGIQGAVVVKEVDKDMSPQERAAFAPGDMRYNLVRWFLARDASFAIGPSRVNPLTGEIFNATVSISEGIVRFFGEDAEFADRRPTRAPASAEDHDPLAAEAAAALAALESRGPLPAEERRRFIDQMLTWLTMHEIGHTLGLRHNFKGSSVVAPDRLGLDSPGSVMDYMPPLLPGAGAPPRDYFQTAVGPYDRWAIEYGYRPLAGTGEAKAAALASIAGRAAADPRLAYGTDEDAANGSDPAVQRYDLSSSPLAFGRARQALAREIWAGLPAQSREAQPGELRRRFLAGYRAYGQGVRAALALVGGIRMSRDPEAEAYRPVPPAEQREALAFVLGSAFPEGAIDLPPELRRRLGADRRVPYEPDVPLTPEQAQLGLQVTVLQHLVSRDTMARLELASRLAPSPSTLSARELLETVRLSAWSELKGKKTERIPAGRRALGRLHVSELIGLAADTAPSDAPALARASLARLRLDLAEALKSKRLDPDSRAHVEDTLARIDGALNPRPDVS